MDENKLRLALGWALERGFRLGWQAGFDIGERAMQRKQQDEFALNKGAKDIIEDEIDNALRFTK